MKMVKISPLIALAGILMLFNSQVSWALEPVKNTVVAKKIPKKEADSDKIAKSGYHFSLPGASQTAPEDSQGTKSSASSTEKKQEVGADYKIMIGDRLNIKIFPEDQYVKGGNMQVSSEGNITLPLVGKVKVADKSLVEAGRLLARIIDQDYLVNAEVVVELSESILKSAEKKKKAIALGQVRRPGSYEFPPEKEKITLLELVSLAGGFTEIANIKKIKLIHKAGGKKETENINGEAVMSGSSPDVEISDGDVVNVAESVF